MADKDFTPRELEIMANAWNCMTSEPQVDYQKLATMCGMSNPRSASNAWSNIKKKILAKGGTTKENGAADGEEGTPKPSPVKTPRKRTAKKAEGEAGGSPTKKAKGGKGKATKSEAKVDDDDEDGSSATVKAEQVENEHMLQ